MKFCYLLKKGKKLQYKLQNSKMGNIYKTEASITNDIMGRDRGIITMLSGAIDNSKINMYLTLDDFRKFPLNLIPKAKIEIEVTSDVNILKVTTSKDVSPLKKGETIIFLFDDGCYFNSRFETGRIPFGREVLNFVLLTNLQLWELTRKRLVQIKICSALEMVYDFIDKPNEQYENENDGQILLQLACNNLVGIKKVLLNIVDVQTFEENNESYPFGLIE